MTNDHRLIHLIARYLTALLSKVRRVHVQVELQCIRQFTQRCVIPIYPFWILVLQYISLFVKHNHNLFGCIFGTWRHMSTFTWYNDSVCGTLHFNCTFYKAQRYVNKIYTQRCHNHIHPYTSLIQLWVGITKVSKIWNIISGGAWSFFR